MRIGGIEINEPNQAILVLPRGDNSVVFKARAILDYDEFHAVCAKPVPPVITVKGGKKADTKNKDYLEALAVYNARLEAWTIIKSLEPSQIEWEKVKLDTPGTWTGWVDELRAAGFTFVEINRIIGVVLEANSLDEEKLKWARESFVLGQQTSPST